MKRVIVLGGLGHFGKTIIAELSKLGVTAMAAARNGRAAIHCDAEDRGSIREAVRPGDLVVDAAGPFHLRSMALLETAIELGFDVIDINDNFAYARQVLDLEPKISVAGIRVVTSASTVSAIAAAVIRKAGVEHPIRLNAYLAPATRYTANPGSALSLLQSLGRPIQIWREGRLQSAIGWTERRSFDMPSPLGRIHARLYESADALHLPRGWPSLREVTMHVDSHVPGVNALLTLAARSEAIRRVMASGVRAGARAARMIGAKSGGVGYEIESADGRIVRYSLIAQEQGYLTAVAPAVLAARAIVKSSFRHVGLVPPNEACETGALITYLRAAGIVPICEETHRN